MRRLLLLLLWGWFWMGGWWGPKAWTTEQVFVYGTTGSLTAGTRYFMFVNDAGPTTDPQNQCLLVPTAGTADSLRVTLSVAPGVGTSWTFTLFDDIDNTVIAVDCTIADSETSCNSAADTAAYSAGDCLILRAIASGATASSSPDATLILDSTTDAESTYGGNSGTTNISTTAVQYHSLGGPAAMQGSEARMKVVMPMGGDWTALRCDLDAAPGAGTSYVFTARVNGADDTDLTCTISDVAGTCSDTATAGQVAVVAGDFFAIQSTPTASPTGGGKARCSATFTATTNGQFFFPYSDNDTMSNAATEYNLLFSSINNWNGTETSVDQLAQSMSILNMYVNLPAGSPGSGNSYTLDLRQDVNSPGLQVVLSDAETSDKATATISINDDDLLATQAVPASTPTARAALISYTGFIDQGGAAQQQYYLISKEHPCEQDFFSRWSCPAHN